MVQYTTGGLNIYRHLEKAIYLRPMQNTSCFLGGGVVFVSRTNDNMYSDGSENSLRRNLSSHWACLPDTLNCTKKVHQIVMSIN